MQDLFSLKAIFKTLFRKRVVHVSQENKRSVFLNGMKFDQTSQNTPMYTPSSCTCCPVFAKRNVSHVTGMSCSSLLITNSYHIRGTPITLQKEIAD